MDKIQCNIYNKHTQYEWGTIYHNIHSFVHCTSEKSGGRQWTGKLRGNLPRALTEGIIRRTIISGDSVLYYKKRIYLHISIILLVIGAQPNQIWLRKNNWANNSK